MTHYSSLSYQRSFRRRRTVRLHWLYAVAVMGYAFATVRVWLLPSQLLKSLAGAGDILCCILLMLGVFSVLFL